MTLSGCERIVYRDVKIPVPVPCIVGVVEKPAMTFLDLAADAPVYQQVKALVVDRGRVIAYVAELEALVEACR